MENLKHLITFDIYTDSINELNSETYFSASDKMKRYSAHQSKKLYDFGKVKKEEEITKSIKVELNKENILPSDLKKIEGYLNSEAIDVSARYNGTNGKVGELDDIILPLAIMEDFEDFKINVEQIDDYTFIIIQGALFMVCSNNQEEVYCTDYLIMDGFNREFSQFISRKCENYLGLDLSDRNNPIPIKNWKQLWNGNK